MGSVTERTEPGTTKRRGKSLFERKQHEAMRVQHAIRGLRVSYWPSTYFPEDEDGTKGNLFSLDIESDEIEMWLDWRDGKRGKLSLPLAAQLLWLAGRVSQMADKFIARENLDRAEVEAMLDTLMERYGE